LIDRRALALVLFIVSPTESVTIDFIASRARTDKPTALNAMIQPGRTDESLVPTLIK
jgi:hypothetical protein